MQEDADRVARWAGGIRDFWMSGFGLGVAAACFAGGLFGIKPYLTTPTECLSRDGGFVACGGEGELACGAGAVCKNALGLPSSSLAYRDDAFAYLIAVVLAVLMLAGLIALSALAVRVKALIHAPSDR